MLQIFLCSQNYLSPMQEQIKHVILHRHLILFRRYVANLHLSRPAAAASKNGFDRYGDPRDPKVNAVDWVDRRP
jgi:hypothetical protein